MAPLPGVAKEKPPTAPSSDKPAATDARAVLVETVRDKLESIEVNPAIAQELAEEVANPDTTESSRPVAARIPMRRSLPRSMHRR